MDLFPTKIVLAAEGSRSSTPVFGPDGQIVDSTREGNIGFVVVGGRGTVIREACCSARVVPGESGA
jgi:hypothetical protein